MAYKEFDLTLSSVEITKIKEIKCRPGRMPPNNIGKVRDKDEKESPPHLIGLQLKAGARLKTLRKKAGLTQVELAEKIGVHGHTISEWELSRYNIPPKRNKQFTEIFGVRVL